MEFVMKESHAVRAWAVLTATVLMAAALTACNGSAGPTPPTIPVTGTPATPAQSAPPAVGTGTLTVSVSDPEGQPLADAAVSVYNPNQGAAVGVARTGSTGVATIESVPAAVRVYVHHPFSESYSNQSFTVAHQGVSFLAVTLLPARPRPTVALLPVTIPAESVSTDRSELRLQVTIVASPAAPFVPAGYGDYTDISTPSLGLALGKFDDTDPFETPRNCFVWMDRNRTVPSCGPWGEPPYRVSVEAFDYDPTGTIPTLAALGPADSAMLVMDQSGRVSSLDPEARRSFASRQFIARALATRPRYLAVAGFAADGSEPQTAALLPEQPLWTPLGAGTIFSTDRAALVAAVSILEPLVGGSAPVFAAIENALTLTAAAPAGRRAVVAVLGGGDDGDMGDSARRETLAALDRQRAESAIQAVLIAAARSEDNDARWALAELAAALSAPAISLGQPYDSEMFGGEHSWRAGLFAALDLAADLIDGLPIPTLSAEFRVETVEPGGFLPGTVLYGVVYVESEICPMGCWEIPLEFAVEIP
jgi:hypothetical protein